MRTINKLVVHHSAAPATQSLATVDAYHRQQNWGTWWKPARAIRSRREWYIQYHYCIVGNGNVTQTRDDDEIGWHARNANETSLGICLFGDFTTGHPTNAQLGSLKTLLRKLIVEYGIPPAAILGHRAVSWTSCPGKNLPASLIASIVNGALEVKPDEPASESLHPGELVKNDGDPKVYVIGRSGVPLWVDEIAFRELYGDFSKVRTVQIPLASTKVLRVEEVS